VNVSAVRGARDVEIAAKQIVVIEVLVDVHRLAQQPRPLRFVPLHFWTARWARSKTARSVSFTLGHDVHTVVHAVNHIHVCVTRRAEHHFRPLGQSLAE